MNMEYSKQADGNTRRPAIADKETGFTLIEVLIAISILSIGLLAIASMQIASIQTTGKAQYVSVGTSWAEDRLEWLMSLDYDDALLANTAPDYVADPNTAPDGYTIEYQVEGAYPRANCKRIFVKTTWNERGINKETIIWAIKPQL